MTSRRRRIALILPAVATFVAMAVVGVFIVVDNEKQQEEVAAATLAGQDYLAEVAALRMSIGEVIEKVGTDDPAQLITTIKKKLSPLPELPEVTAYGRMHSANYRDALAVEASLIEPYDDLLAVLQRATTAKAFIDAAKKVLDLRASDYLGTAPVSSSSLVRSTVIPAFRRGLAEFQSVPVPDGQAALADQVSSAVQYVIDQTTTLANNIDARRSFSFTYDKQFNAAITAVNDFQTVIDGDVAEAVAAVMPR